jgi:rRNA maturation protein Nop10
MRRTNCPNLNHRRIDPPVGFCPMCGTVVNENIPTRRCTEGQHGKRRREMTKYCVDCGRQLIKEI